MKEFKVWRLGILERRYSCPRRCLDNVMLTQTVSLGSLSSWHGCWALGQIDSACSSKLLKSRQIQVKGLNKISWTSYLCASQGIRGKTAVNQEIQWKAGKPTIIRSDKARECGAWLDEHQTFFLMGATWTRFNCFSHQQYRRLKFQWKCTFGKIAS